MIAQERRLSTLFPAGFTLCGTWGEAMRQIGNAVPVKLAEIIGRRLHTLLLASPSQSPALLYRTGTDGAYMLFERSDAHPIASARPLQKNKRALRIGGQKTRKRPTPVRFSKGSMPASNTFREGYA